MDRSLKLVRDRKRFWSKVEKTNHCWNWKAGLSNGYGYFYVNGKTRQAYKYAFELENGPVKNGLTLDHLCRNPLCVRPSHLEAVTMRENVLRGVGPTAINARNSSCLSGHPFDNKNTAFYGGGRMCIACKRRRWHEWKARKEAANV